MRLFLLAVVLCFTCAALHAQQAFPFSISGKFTSRTQSGTIYLYYPVNATTHKDSCLVKNGVFHFSGKLLHPSAATLSFNNKGKDIFIEPKPMNLMCDDELNKIEIKGSKSESEFLEITNKLSRIDWRWKIIFDTLDAVNLRSNVAFQEMKNWVLQPYFAEIRETYLHFFETHPQSFVTAYYLSLNVIEMNQGVFSTDSLQIYFNRFRTPVKKSWYGKKINQELGKRKVAISGAEAFDFTQTDINSQTLSLSSFRGKYVLLDFWGSWCVPCRKGNPHLKELYHQYKDQGFDIIGIAKDDDTRDAWVKAVEKDGLPWHQILVGDLDTKYNVTSYPTKILVDQQGIIIGRYGENEKELDEQLNSIFK